MKNQFDKLSQYYRWRLAEERRWMRVLFVLIAIFAVFAFFFWNHIVAYIALGAEIVLAAIYFIFGAVMREKIRSQEQRELALRNKRAEQWQEDNCINICRGCSHFDCTLCKYLHIPKMVGIRALTGNPRS